MAVYLKHKTEIIAKCEFSDTCLINAEYAYFEGTIWKANGWLDVAGEHVIAWEYHSDVCIKFDGCSHWSFYGEDYNPEDEKPEKDSYYHLCGQQSFLDHIRLMVFAWKCAGILYRERYAKHGTNFIENEFNDPMLDTILEGYELEIEISN